MTQQQKQHQSQDSKLMEGLRRADLKDMVDNLFTVDQFQSKMGDDKNTIVLRFRAANKEPAVDLMEFIEKGYNFVLDADTSSGEERDGKYSVFVEVERTKHAPAQIKELMNGLSQLCDCTDWRFRWYKDIGGHDFSEDAIAKIVPLTPEDYEKSIEGQEAQEVAEFFDQGAIDSIEVDENKTITFTKPYASPLTAKIIAVGEYNTLKDALKGALQLDESSRGQVMYLNKYLGNYDINKIEDHFLIRNGERAVILAKTSW
jgi:hypothetical protein